MKNILFIIIGAGLVYLAFTGKAKPLISSVFGAK